MKRKRKKKMEKEGEEEVVRGGWLRGCYCQERQSVCHGCWLETPQEHLQTCSQAPHGSSYRQHRAVGEAVGG